MLRISRPIRLALIALLAVVCGALAYAKFRYDFIPKRFGVVVPGQIYRSGQLSARMIKPTIQQYGIGVVIDFQPATDEPAQAAERKMCQELGIAHQNFGLNGNGTGDIQRYAEALTLLMQAQRAGKPVLMHCAAGTQRTGAATAFYRLLIEHKSPQEVYTELSRYGWNPQRDAILVSYINESIGQLAAMLVANGVLDKLPDPLPRLP